MKQEDYTQISISKELKREFAIARAKLGYTTWEEFMKDLLNKFKEKGK